MLLMAMLRVELLSFMMRVWVVVVSAVLCLLLMVVVVLLMCCVVVDGCYDVGVVVVAIAVGFVIGCGIVCVYTGVDVVAVVVRCCCVGCC